MGDKSLRDYDLFIFDWDGTLCEMQGVLRANEWLKRRLHTWDRAARIKELEANKRNLKRAIEIEESKNRLIASIFEVLTIFYKPRLHRGVAELLTLLKKKGKKVAILSNGDSGRLSKELEKAGIRNLFDAVVSAKDIGAMKPDPGGIRAICTRLHVKESRAVYFGDMVDDVLTADLAKVASCAISDGFDSHAKLASARPTYLLRSIEELRRRLATK